MFTGIIQKRSDNDAYKFFMGDAAFHNYYNIPVEYNFQCRNKDVNLAEFVSEIELEIKHYFSLMFTKNELEFMRDSSNGVMSKEYLHFLSTHRLDIKGLKVSVDENKLIVRVSGLWAHYVEVEVPILSIINEVYFRNTQPNANRTTAMEMLFNKIALVHGTISEEPGFNFMEFGTRRRFSADHQRDVVKALFTMLPSTCFLGTSNVMLAMENNSAMRGTVAHEWGMAHQQLVPLRESLKAATNVWMNHFKGKLGIMLPDLLGTETFLKDFDLIQAKVNDGFREDSSGDPVKWARELIIPAYKNFGIDPMTKKVVPSDGLDIPDAIDIWKELHREINVTSGIGTKLTNHFPDFNALNIVMKMVMCNGGPVAKRGDKPGKGMCESPVFLNNVYETFNIKDN